MFATACATDREAIYGLLASSPLKPRGVTVSNGSAFMVAAGYLITAAHCVHQGSNHKKPVHSKLELIRVPDIKAGGCSVNSRGCRGRFFRGSSVLAPLREANRYWCCGNCNWRIAAGSLPVTTWEATIAARDSTVTPLSQASSCCGRRMHAA